MRMIGAIEDQASAQRFGDFLVTLGIENDVEPASAGWAVWVHDDDQLDQGKAELEKFLAEPDAPRYKSSQKTAKAVKREKKKKRERMAANYIDTRTQSSWADRVAGPRPLCFALIAASLIVGGFTRLGEDQGGVSQFLMFSPFPDWEELVKNADPEKLAEYSQRFALEQTDEGYAEFSQRGERGILREVYGFTGFEKIQSGEAWRLFTPMFLHFGWLHILFNLLWVFDLGGVVEQKKGTLFLLILVLVVALISHVAQCWFSGPFFGGMSGVVYGLLGYVWMKSKYQPHEGLRLAKNTIIYMLIWLVVCMTGAIGPIANTAHIVGLLVGMAFGVTPYFFNKWRRERATT